MINNISFDCESNNFTLTSDYFSQYVNETSITSIDINGKINCCETVYSTKLINSTVCSWKATTRREQTTIELTNPTNTANRIWSTKFNVNGVITEAIPFGITYNLDNPVEVAQYNAAIIGFMNLHGGGNVSVVFSTIDGYSYVTVNMNSLSPNFTPISVSYLSDQNLFESPKYTTFFGCVEKMDIDKIEIVNDTIIIKPLFYNMAELTDGIYQFDITINFATGTKIKMTKCIFRDCITKCKVFSYLATLDKTEESDIHLLHFALTNAINCECKCEDMCIIYEKILTILGETPSKNCTTC